MRDPPWFMDFNTMKNLMGNPFRKINDPDNLSHFWKWIF